MSSIGIRFVAANATEFDGATLVSTTNVPLANITRLSQNRFNFAATAAIGRFYPNDILAMIGQQFRMSPLDIVGIKSGDLAHVTDWMLERAVMFGAAEPPMTGTLGVISPPETAAFPSGALLRLSPPELTTDTAGVLLFGVSGRLGPNIEEPAVGGVEVLPTGYGVAFTTVGGGRPAAEFTLFPFATARDLGCLACGVPSVSFVAPEPPP
jgi:hypothetical protein